MIEFIRKIKNLKLCDENLKIFLLQKLNFGLELVNYLDY
jgi:hypothetical protein